MTKESTVRVRGLPRRVEDILDEAQANARKVFKFDLDQNPREKLEEALCLLEKAKESPSDFDQVCLDRLTDLVAWLRMNSPKLLAPIERQRDALEEMIRSRPRSGPGLEQGCELSIEKIVVELSLSLLQPWYSLVLWSELREPEVCFCKKEKAGERLELDSLCTVFSPWSCPAATSAEVKHNRQCIPYLLQRTARVAAMIAQYRAHLDFSLKQSAGQYIYLELYCQMQGSVENQGLGLYETLLVLGGPREVEEEDRLYFNTLAEWLRLWLLALRQDEVMYRRLVLCAERAGQIDQAEETFQEALHLLSAKDEEIVRQVVRSPVFGTARIRGGLGLQTKGLAVSMASVPSDREKGEAALRDARSVAGVIAGHQIYVDFLHPLIPSVDRERTFSPWKDLGPTWNPRPCQTSKEIDQLIRGKGRETFERLLRLGLVRQSANLGLWMLAYGQEGGAVGESEHHDQHLGVLDIFELLDEVLSRMAEETGGRLQKEVQQVRIVLHWATWGILPDNPPMLVLTEPGTVSASHRPRVGDS